MNLAQGGCGNRVGSPRVEVCGSKVRSGGREINMGGPEKTAPGTPASGARREEKVGGEANGGKTQRKRQPDD